MRKFRRLKQVSMMVLALLLFVQLLPLPSTAVAAETGDQQRFIRVEPSLFQPGQGEKTTIRWNWEIDHVTVIKLMSGDQVAAVIHVLMVDRIGKHFSGTGMDTNIIGSVRIPGVEEFPSPRIKYIIAGDLDDSSQGNALGVGLADLTTQRLFNKIDFAKTNENVITSSFLRRGMIPIVLDNDRQALDTALRSNWGVQP